MQEEKLTNSIYEKRFVEELFDKMSGTYDRMNHITSFGFSARWRKQFIKDLNIENAKVVVDLMSGMGECWKPILHHCTPETEIIALDFSGEMVKHAKNRIASLKSQSITVLKEDVFNNSIASSCADSVVSGFGLKTFSEEQLNDLAKQIHRILKPNGTFSLIDVSVPSGKILKFFYLFYLKRIIPVLGWLFLGKVSTYKMLGVYTEKFQNAQRTKQLFERHSFEVEYYTYFFGCASGIKGKKRPE